MLWWGCYISSVSVPIAGCEVSTRAMWVTLISLNSSNRPRRNQGPRTYFKGPPPSSTYISLPQKESSSHFITNFYGEPLKKFISDFYNTFEVSKSTWMNSFICMCIYKLICSSKLRCKTWMVRGSQKSKVVDSLKHSRSVEYFFLWSIQI